LIQTFRLENGIKVILEPFEHTGTLSIGFWVLNGSRDEPEHQHGYTHFLEHMLFKGTGNRTAYQIAQQIDRVGGYLNAFSEKELTAFYCTLPSEHSALAIEVISDMFHNSLLAEEELEKEKQVIINEIKAIEDNPEEKGHELFLKAMWDGHPLSRRISGDEEDVEAITRAGLAEFLKERFIPANIVVSAAGRMDPDRIVEQLNKALAPLAAAGTGFQTVRLPPRRIRSWESVPDKFNQVNLFTGLAYHPSGLLEDYYSELVFSTLFGESMSSRLFQRVRENEGLCYSAYSFRTYYSDAALWTVYVNTEPHLVGRLLTALNEELSLLHREPPQETEVADTKSQLRGNVILSREDMETRMKRLLRQYVITGRVLEHEEWFRILDAVSREDVAAAVKRLVQPEQFNLLAYGSSSAKDLKLKKYEF
jgi:predicted Zn-dependent peptidase